MTTDLSKLFPSLQVLTERPKENDTKTYLFHNEYTDSWLKINKSEVSERDYTLLQSLYKPLHLESYENSDQVEKWVNFLYKNGPVPLNENHEIRVIQLHVQKEYVDLSDMEASVQAYFGDTLQLVILSEQKALLIEQWSTYNQSIEDFYSFLGILESDFFIKIKMYIGKFHALSLNFSKHFLQEEKWFMNGLAIFQAESIYTMEKLFPVNLVANMPDELKRTLVEEVLKPVNYDVELLQTVRLFFENGFNASVTAKNMHVHRNTLQYRLTKFQEVTGISIRQFDGALVAYCASILSLES